VCADAARGYRDRDELGGERVRTREHERLGLLDGA